MPGRARVGCLGALFVMMLSCVSYHLWSGPLLEYQMHALAPSPYPESTFMGTGQSDIFDNAYKEIHYFCTKDPSFMIERYYVETLSEPCLCRSLPEASKFLGLMSTGRYFGGAVYLRTYPRHDRCEGGTLYSFEYVWAK